MSAPLRKSARRSLSDAARPSLGRDSTPPPTDGERGPDTDGAGPSTELPSSTTVAAAAGSSLSSTRQTSRPAATLLHRTSGLQSCTLSSSIPAGNGGGWAGNVRTNEAHTVAAVATPARHPASPTSDLNSNSTTDEGGNGGGTGAGLPKNSAAAFGCSPGARTRAPYSPSALSSGAVQSPTQQQVPFSPYVAQQIRATTTIAADRSSGASPTGSPTTTTPIVTTLPSNMPLGGLTNHLRLSEGLSCLDYHAGFRALAIGSTRQIHVVEVIPMVGHDVAATARFKRSQQQQQHAAAADSSHLYPQNPLTDKQPHITPSPDSSTSSSPPSPKGSAPFLMRNTGVFGGLIKVESVAWYPSTEEASLAFIQPARTVTIFLDALQFKADGTYLPQQWTRSQYKGKTLNATMAAGGGSTAMAVVANLDGGLAGITPATLMTSLGDRSSMYTPVSTSVSGGASFSGPTASHGGTLHEASIPTPGSGGSQPGLTLAMSNLPSVYRELKGPAARELIELNIDITYMRVEKIVWDPHQPYTLALSSPITHFELWQVPTEGMRVYAPQLVLRPPAHNTRSVVRDIVFSPSNPHIIIVVTEYGNTGQVLLYDRRQVEAMRVFDVNGPGLSAAFHPLFSDLLAVSFRKEKTKPDTRISFLRMMPGGTVPKAAFTAAEAASVTAADGTPASSSVSGVAARVHKTSTLMSTAASAAVLEESTNSGGGGGAGRVPASACPFLAEQSYLPPIDNYACISRMRWRPPSLGHLTEPKQHHYMFFKPSAEELLVARHFSSLLRTVKNGEQEGEGEEDETNWVDILHSQLWLATAAVMMDSDLSVWDAANGFFPVCAVKYLGTRLDSSTSNEANDFIWVNELTLVSIFKSGEVICTSFLNSLLEETVFATESYVRSLRSRRKSSQQRSHRTRSPVPQARLTQQQQILQYENKARDDYAEQRRKTREEEKACLAMLPTYPHDAYADMFATYIVLPTSSIVSDLFGRSFAIRNSNFTVRRQYGTMMRREFGQLLRRLTIQVSREAVLRKQWAEMRYQLPAGGPSSPVTEGGIAALQDLRARRSRSPFTQTIDFHGRGTSSLGSNSTPPSPRRSMLTRRCSAASSVSSFSTRPGLQPSTGTSTTNDRSSSTGVTLLNPIATANPFSVTGTTTATTTADRTTMKTHSTLPSLPFPRALAQLRSFDYVNDALLPRASQQDASASPTGAFENSEGCIPGQRARHVGRGGGGSVRTGTAGPTGGDGVDGAGGLGNGDGDVVSSYEEREHDEDEEVDAVETAAANPLRTRSGTGFTGWITRILGFARHKRLHRYHMSGSQSRAASTAHAANFFSVEPVYPNESDVLGGAAAIGEDNNVEFAIPHSPTVASPACRRQTFAPSAAAAAASASALAAVCGTSTSPISVNPLENSESSIGSPQQTGAAVSDLGYGAGASSSASLARSKRATAHFSDHRTISGSASSSSPPLFARVGDATNLSGASAQGGGVLFYAEEGSTNYSRLATATTAPPPTSPTSGLNPGSLKNRRSSVIFTQIFPLLKEYVNVGGDDRSTRGVRASRSPSAPQPTNSARRVDEGIIDTLSKDTKADALTRERGGRKPALLLSPLLPPMNDAPHSSASSATASPVLLPLSVLEYVVPAADTKAVSAPNTPAVKRMSALKSNPAPAHLITARAYLDRQRDVTAVVESFVLSDMVCGWSYPERKLEEFAFVRFALEWDMGYEVALSMKALRNDRADTEAAAEAAEVEYAEEPPEQDVNCGAGTDNPLWHTQRTNSNSRERQQQQQRRSSSGSNGPVPCRRHGHRDPPSQDKYSPTGASIPVFFTAKSGGRLDGTRSSDDRERCSQPFLDWGKGVPTPSHKDVDDKVAAMMEENARICERVLRQQRRNVKGISTNAPTAATGAETTHANGAVASYVKGDVMMMAIIRRDEHHDSTNADSGELRSPFLSNDEGSLNTTDPRAQWWRAASHAWRSHHISFILAITMQQLEYAALMGDVQYCLVLYILFCLWWRLHCEVAEAAYKAELASFQKAMCGFGDNNINVSKTDKHGQPFTALRDDVNAGGVGGVGSRENWTGDEDDGERGKQHQQHYPPYASSQAVKSKLASSAGDQQRRTLGVPTMTSVDSSFHDGVAESNDFVLNYRPTPYGLVDVSEGSPSNAAERSSYQYESEKGKENTLVLLERLEMLHHLCLFFQRCPLMPMIPEVQQQQSPSVSAATTTATVTATANTAAPSSLRAAGGGEMVERGFKNGPINALMERKRGVPPHVSGGFGGYLRRSTSNQSLPTRSQNSSSHQRNDSPVKPEMAYNVRDHSTTRKSMIHLGVLAASHQSSTVSPGSPILHVDLESGTKTNKARTKPAEITRLKENRFLLVNVEGLLGVRLYARSAEDLCASADYCPPEEWKLRSLQWLETYTADLYARQLYVPLNELLLVIPEIFREPTNPVQPRAADIAYEKQMTYVYCGSCSKAELWSRTQQETVPASVRLYEHVLRHRRHSSSSEENEDDSDYHGAVGSSDERSENNDGKNSRRGRRHPSCRSCGNQHHDHRSGRNETDEWLRDKEESLRRRKQRRHRRSNTRPTAANTRGSGRRMGSSLDDSDDVSSSICTPSVESPTTSSNSDDNSGDHLLATHEAGHRASSMNSDVSLSSEHSTHGGNGSVAELFGPTEAATGEFCLDDGGSRAGTGGGSRASVPRTQVPSPAQSLRSKQPQRRHKSRARTHHSRRILTDEQLSYDLDKSGRGEDDRNEDAEVGGLVNALASHNPLHRHTAVGCYNDMPTANNAACRRCHNRVAMTCVICEEVVEGVFFWLRSCGHGGHVHHMEEWLQHSQECPKCGTPIATTWKGS